MEGKSCCGKIKHMKSQIDGFKSNSIFFTYEQDNLEQIQTEDVKGTPSYQAKTKKILTVLAAIAVFFGIINQYLQKLGTEKSQSLIYVSHTNLSYSIPDIPRLLPAHQFTFFDRKEITDRMMCKIEGDEEQCRKIEERRCLSKGNLTEAYDICMIKLLKKEEGDPEEFCRNHYGFKTIWVDELSPKYLMYYQRMHNCLRLAGIPLAKAYCDDLFAHSEGWTQESLFSCYRKHKVEFAKEYCKFLFQEESQAQQLLQCLGQKGLEKGEEYCEITFPDPQIEERIGCYDNIPLKNVKVCDLKWTFNSWTDEQTRACYLDANYTLNKEFCDEHYLTVDDRYACYARCGLGIFKDREFCELQFPKDSGAKYDCLDQNGIPKLADYCYYKYFWEDEYQERQDCLTSEGVPTTGVFCLEKFGSIRALAKRRGEEYDDTAEFQCLAEYNINKFESQCPLEGNGRRMLQEEEARPNDVDGEGQGQQEPWDCSNSMFPTNNNDCWAAEAYQTCAGQWAYDAVIKAGGSGKDAWELLEALKRGDCASCDISKAGCENSMYPEGQNKSCWPATAYQKCTDARQEANDAIYVGGKGDLVLSYCFYSALIKNNCSVVDAKTWTFVEVDKTEDEAESNDADSRDTEVAQTSNIDPDWIKAEKFVAEFKQVKKNVVFGEISKLMGNDSALQLRKANDDTKTADLISNYVQDPKYFSAASYQIDKESGAVVGDITPYSWFDRRVTSIIPIDEEIPIVGAGITVIFRVDPEISNVNSDLPYPGVIGGKIEGITADASGGTTKYSGTWFFVSSRAIRIHFPDLGDDHQTFVNYPQFSTYNGEYSTHYWGNEEGTVTFSYNQSYPIENPLQCDISPKYETGAEKELYYVVNDIFSEPQVVESVSFFAVNIDLAGWTINVGLMEDELNQKMNFCASIDRDDIKWGQKVNIKCQQPQKGDKLVFTKSDQSRRLLQGRPPQGGGGRPPGPPPQEEQPPPKEEEKPEPKDQAPPPEKISISVCNLEVNNDLWQQREIALKWEKISYTMQLFDNKNQSISEKSEPIQAKRGFDGKLNETDMASRVQKTAYEAYMNADIEKIWDANSTWVIGLNVNASIHFKDKDESDRGGERRLQADDDSDPPAQGTNSSLFWFNATVPYYYSETDNVTLNTSSYAKRVRDLGIPQDYFISNMTNLTISDHVLSVLKNHSHNWTSDDLYYRNTTLDDPNYIYMILKDEPYSLDTFQDEIIQWVQENYDVKNESAVEEAGKQIFAMIDRNDDGKVDEGEFIEFGLNESKRNPEKEELQSIFSLLDLNGDRMIGYDEFFDDDKKQDDETEEEEVEDSEYEEDDDEEEEEAETVPQKVFDKKQFNREFKRWIKVKFNLLKKQEDYDTTQITKPENSTFSEIFEFFDLDQDNRINMTEVFLSITQIMNLSVQLTDKDKLHLFQRFDFGNSSNLTYSQFQDVIYDRLYPQLFPSNFTVAIFDLEFAKWMENQFAGTESLDQKLRKTFEAFDINDSKVIEKDDFKTTVEKISKMRPSNKDVDVIFTIFDQDRSGSVPYEEFVSVLNGLFNFTKPPYDRQACLKKETDEFSAQCHAKFDTEPRDAENLHACLKQLTKYGYEKTPQYCLDQLQVTDDKFFYKLKNKYECLNSPDNQYRTEIGGEPLNCLSLYFEYQIDTCLQLYEAKYGGKMGFKGQVYIDKLGEEAGSLFTEYGNITEEIPQTATQQEVAPSTTESTKTTENVETAAPSSTQNAEETEEKQFQEEVQVGQNQELNREVSFTTTQYEQFICNNAKMIFYQNPVSGNPQAVDYEQNKVQIDMSCRIFDTDDKIVSHFFFSNETLVIEEGTMMINRTDLNENYFNLTFDQDLEFIKMEKNQMYLKEQNYLLDVVETPQINSLSDYEQFRSEGTTIRMYESHPQTIALQMLPPIVLETRPLKNIYVGKKAILSILGYDLLFTDVEQNLIKTDAENEIKYPRDHLANVTTNQIRLQFTFFEQVFTWTYFNMVDILEQLGGIGNAIEAALGQFAVIFVLLYLVDLIRTIYGHYKKDFYQAKYDELMKELDEDLGVARLIQEEKDAAKEGGFLENPLSNPEYKHVTAKDLIHDISKEKVSKDIKRMEDLKANRLQENKDETDFTKLEELCDELEDLGAIYKEYVVVNEKLHKRDCTTKGAPKFEDSGAMSNLIDQRLNLSFFQIAHQIKQRVSFFGIYSCHDKVRESQVKLDHFKQQLRDSIKEIYDRQEALEKISRAALDDGAIPTENPQDIRRRVTRMSTPSQSPYDGLPGQKQKDVQKFTPVRTKTLQSKRRTGTPSASKSIEFKPAQDLESGDDSETIGPSIFKKKKSMRK